MNAPSIFRRPGSPGHRSPASALTFLSQQPPRRSADHAGTEHLYLPRIGAIVLPHTPYSGGWRATVTRNALALPAGTQLAIPDIEITTALPVPEHGHPLDEVDGPTYAMAWRTRVLATTPTGRTPRLAQLLTEHLDPQHRTVDLTTDTHQTFHRTIGTTGHGLGQLLANLTRHQLLRPHATTSGHVGRHTLTLPDYQPAPSGPTETGPRT